MFTYEPSAFFIFTRNFQSPEEYCVTLAFTIFGGDDTSRYLCDVPLPFEVQPFDPSNAWPVSVSVVPVNVPAGF